MEREMSKQMASGRKPSGVIARLMGLDALPAQHLNPIPSRVTPEGCKQRSQQKQPVYVERTNLQCVQSLQSHADEESKYKDVYEVQNQALRTTYFTDESRSPGRFHDKLSQKKMTLVQHKFLEANCLAKNQNLHQSKDFWDAIKVLNSDTDTFLEFLQETNLLSDYLPNMTDCITVLEPTKTLDAPNEKQFKKENTLAEVKVWGRNKHNRSSETLCSNPASLSHPTRIVVLKPSPSKSNLKELISSPTLQKRSPNGEYPFEELGNYETSGTREMAKKITQQMRESFSSNRRDESLPFSSLSNGYIGDDSSFRSESMYMEEEFSNSSYPQVATPTSHHLWDYVHRVTSPYSPSSCSRASYSPESSVIREARKRLSDRLAMVGTNEVNQEQKKVQRSSSTLGEMLAVSETRNERGIYEEFIPNSRSLVEVQDMKAESSSSSKNQAVYLKEIPHRNLQRSLSVPSSSAVYENIETHLEVQKEITKTKDLKLSIRGKVSSFFSRNKKSTKEKPLASTLSDPLDKTSYSSAASKCNVLLDCVSDYPREEGPNHIFEKSQSRNLCASPDNNCLKGGSQFAKESLSLEKPGFSGIPNQNSEQPSPVSVLEIPLEEDTSSCSSQSHDGASLECHRTISKSSLLIESVARSLCLDDDACANNDLETHKPGFNSKEKERMDFVKSLLSSSGFDNQTTSSSLTNWYSHLSPLNPSLLEKFLDHKDEDAKCRERRSRQRLLFDCVNHALMEIIHFDVSNACRHQPTHTNLIAVNENPIGTLVTDEVIEQVNSWFSSDDITSTCPELGDNTGMIVHCFLKKEVCGREWEEMIYLEVMDVEREIERCMMEELVTEVLDGFIVFR